MGGILWLGPGIIRGILSLYGNELPGQDLLLAEIKNRFPIEVLLVSVGIVVPILEEFMFRYWIKSKKKPRILLLFALMGGYVAFSTFWWIGVGGFLLCALLDCVLRDNSDARILMLIPITTLLFVLAHITEFSEFNIDTALCLTQLFGLGLLACWMVYNVGFWWACLLHALNNILALLVVILVPTPPLYTPTAISFETQLYSASLQPISGDPIDFREINDSTVVVIGSLPVIAFNLAKEFNPSIISGTYSPTEVFRIHSDYKEPSWKYTLKFIDTIPYKNAPWLATDLANHSRLRIDTTYENVYVLGIEDQQKLNEASGKINNTLMRLAEEIRIDYDCPIVLEKGTNEYFPIRYDNDLLSYPYDIDALPSTLSEKLGLFMYKSNIHKIQVIRFSYGNK